ncbi:PilZ domain-containing protein [Aestuariivirga sp.]|uniref:PilZ domain-containing protein n=1 Tax=Aestuariivirga sp. TaxID=2650926 RepID=UPI003BAC8E13
MANFGKRLAPAAESAALMPQTFSARLVLPGGKVHGCEVTAMDPDSARIITAKQVLRGTSVSALIEDVGRVDGLAGEAADDGFWMEFTFSGKRHAQFVRHLRWLIRREQQRAQADRRHTRFAPQDGTARITLPGGREMLCEVQDISLSGAGIKSPTLPSIGSPVTLGRMRGRVVRHLDGGFAIEFLTPLEGSDLDSALC